MNTAGTSVILELAVMGVVKSAFRNWQSKLWLVSQKCLGHNWLNSLFYSTQAVQSPILSFRPTSWGRRAGGGPPKAPAEIARGLPALLLAAIDDSS